MYSCKQCSAPATLENGAVKKSCSCQCGVITELRATATRGGGGISETTPLKRFTQAVLVFFKGLKKSESN